MIVRLDEQAFSTLKLFLLSCHSTLGEEALITFFNFKGPFPVHLRDTLRDFSWVVEELPSNVFKRLEEYAQQIEKTELSPEDICLFFGEEDHLSVVKNSCIVYSDLSPEERLVGHLTLPVRITDICENKLFGQVTYNGLPVSNIANPFEEVNLGDVVLAHFATVVLPNPSPELLTKLSSLQKDFINKYLTKAKKLSYKNTFIKTKAKLKKYF